VLIYDHEREATVTIEGITHGHFSPYNAGISEGERDAIVTEMVMDFLEGLLNDRIVLWKATDVAIGGWLAREYVEQRSLSREDREYYVWSGPYEVSQNDEDTDQRAAD